MLFGSNTNSCPGQNSLKNQIRFGSLNSLPQEIPADIKPFLPAPASPVPIVLEVLLFNRIQLKSPVGYVSRSFSPPYFSLMAIKYKHWTDGLADAPWFILGENANNHWSEKHAGPRLSIGILHKPGKEEL